MKRSSIWAGIIGGLMIANSGYSLAQHLTNPTTLFWVNVTITVTKLAWIALGIFIISWFIKGQQKEGTEMEIPKPTFDSPEYINQLANRRNYILGFALLVETIGSIEPWIINNYTSGFSLLNIAIIFDLLMHIVFIYIIFQLFRGKKDVLQLLFYSAIAYAGGWLLFNTLREHWFGAFLSFALGVYFIYAVKAQISRRNYRIAHFIILPAYIILLSIAPFFDNGNIIELTKKENLAEQQFLNESGNLNGAYQLFLQREVPGKKEIDDVRNAISKRESRIADVVSLIDQLQEENKKQLPSVFQQKTLENMRFFLQIMEIHSAQSDKVGELMNYAESVNFSALTDQQISDVRRLTDEIESFNTKLTEVQFEQANANID